MTTCSLIDWLRMWGPSNQGFETTGFLQPVVLLQCDMHLGGSGVDEQRFGQQLSEQRRRQS